MSTAPKYPEAPWEAQQFPELDLDEVPPFQSVEQAVRESLRDRGGKAFDPCAVATGGKDADLAMVARAYVLVALDRVQPVEAREEFILYVEHGSVARLAKVLHRRKSVVEARVEEVRKELHAILSARGIVGP